MKLSTREIQQSLGSSLTESDLSPLPPETYPRVIDSHPPDTGYYVALGLVMSVWMITPLSCAYLLWFILLRHDQGGLLPTLFASYALTEVVFAIYHHYLVRWAQGPSPPSILPFEFRYNMFMKILTLGLKYPKPTPSLPDPDDPLRAYHIDLYRKYTAGAISAKQYRHLMDKRYREIHGMDETRRVGRITGEEKDVLQAFVEEVPGERDRRLKEEIEKGVGVLEEFEDEGIMDEHGNMLRLHPSDGRAIEFRERMRTWFNHAPWSSIRRENILTWLAWSFYELPLDQVESNPTTNDHLLKVLALVEARTGTTFPPGCDPSIPLIRVSLDPVNAKGRPLILYALSNSANWFLREIVFPYQGMALYREGEIEYLIKIPTGWTIEKGRSNPSYIPIMYLHGLGFGLLQSAALITHLNKDQPDHPVVIPLAYHTSQALFQPRHLKPWGRKELVEGVKGICERWGFWTESKGRPIGGISLLSHSNGSVFHAWILKDCSSLVKRSTFVDPVVFCLWEGDVSHSVLYRKPSNALQLLLYYFISSEVGIAHYLQRHFDWASNCLFFDEIPNGTDPSRTAFFLGGKDMILDADRVRRYLLGHGVNKGLHWDQTLGHGEGLDGKTGQRVVRFVTTGEAW